jgi:hypothetical protein
MELGLGPSQSSVTEHNKRLPGTTMHTQRVITTVRDNVLLQVLKQVLLNKDSAAGTVSPETQ